MDFVYGKYFETHLGGQFKNFLLHKLVLFVFMEISSNQGLKLV